GSFYVVLEYVDGGDLSRRLRNGAWPPDDAARLVVTLARTMDYAHSRGILHRDLEPSIILFTKEGTPKITDFGLAKLIIGGSSMRTMTGDLLGTPSYMAPEQAGSLGGKIGPATDVYALGAIFYEMLTGRPPFKAEQPMEKMRQVLSDEPVSPSRLRPRLPRDLETICLKCLHKEPARRFADALALADDLRRFLEGRPIRTRRSTLTERSWRWCRRNPWPTAAAALLTIVAIGSTIAAWGFHRDGQRIRRADRETRVNLFESLTAQAQAWRFSRRPGQRFESLDVLGRASSIARELDLPPDRFDRLRDEAIAAMAFPDIKPTGRVIHRPTGMILVAFDPAMTRYAMRFRDGTIKIRRVADDAEIDRFEARGDRDIAVFRFSPDGRYLATTHVPGFALTVRDVDRGTVALDAPGPVAWPAARFSPDGRRIALCRWDGATLIYDLATGRQGGSWAGPASGADLAFRADGARIATLHNEQDSFTCRIVESETGRLVGSIKLQSRGDGVAWGPDGTTLATACTDSKIYLWDAATGRREAVLQGATNAGLYAAFHPAGTLVASNGWEGRLRLWDPILGRPWLTLTGGSGAEFSRDGRIVVVQDEAVTTYEVDPALEYRTLAHAFGEPIVYWRASIRHDGRVLALGTDRGVALWDLARGTELPFLPIGQSLYALFEASGDLLTSSRGSLGVCRWQIRLDPDRGEFRIGPPRRLQLPPGAAIAEDQAGRTLAGTSRAFAVVTTPGRTVRVGPLDDVRHIAVSPDGEWLATGSHQRGAQVWRIRDAMKVAELSIDSGTEVTFSPDGRWLMTQASPCRLWEPGTGREVRQIGGAGRCFSPDGRHLLVQDANNVLRLVEVETGRTVARLESPDSCAVGWATFSPDGSRLAMITNEGPAVHVWDLRAIRRRLDTMGLDWDASAFPGDDRADPSAPPLPPLQVELNPLDGPIDPPARPGMVH
ncbi:MAG: protein kinase domain-containing protein, partial [Isosphaeraceae bacterium]